MKSLWWITALDPKTYKTFLRLFEFETTFPDMDKVHAYFGENLSIVDMKRWD